MSDTNVSTMRAWRTHRYAPPHDALHLDTVPIPEPGPGEVRVRVQAIPLNLNDIERICGGNMMVRPELPYSPGMEVMGVVDAAGAGAESLIGKRVAAITKGACGGYAEYALCPQASTFEMPDDIALPDAAALLFPFHLAWLALHDRAAIQAGDTVLIHAAAGGAGSAAIQLAVNAGARVIATAGSDDKLYLCRSFGAELAINYASDDFAAAALAFTANKGVDIVFDTVGEAVMEKSMNAIAYNGRYVMVGFASNKENADEKFIVPRRLALGNFKLCGVMLAYLDDAIAPLLKQGMGWNFATHSQGVAIHNQLIELVRTKKICAVVGQTASFDQIPDAISAMAQRQTIGRTVVML